MKSLIVVSLVFLANPALARILGGSGGTSGGNPKPTIAGKYSATDRGARKLQSAVQLLRARLQHNCFPHDYNQAVLTELNWLIETDEIYYFPETVMLGANRYDGDYGTDRLPNGDYVFFRVGAFTEKTKGAPIFLTQDSDIFSVEELAMTLAQDLNDHILQWNNERDLNTVAEMAIGIQKCEPLDWSVYKVFEQFPEPESQFEHRKQALFVDLEKMQKEFGAIRIGSNLLGFKTKDVAPTRDGFVFIPTAFYFWNDKGIEVKPLGKSRLLEAVFNPFKNVSHGDGLFAIIRDAKSGTVITEFIYSPGKSDKMLFDPLCDSRSFDGNNSIRWPVSGSGGRFDADTACALKIFEQSASLQIHRQREEICTEYEQYDFFNKTKSVDDVANEVYCRQQNYLESEFKEIVGSKPSEDFVNELIELNERYYNQEHDHPKAFTLPWMRKNVLGGRLDVLPDALAIARDENGKVYSVYVSGRGVFKTAQGVENLDDLDDYAFQCFFKGPRAGTCSHRDYKD